MILVLASDQHCISTDYYQTNPRLLLRMTLQIRISACPDPRRSLAYCSSLLSTTMPSTRACASITRAPAIF